MPSKRKRGTNVSTRATLKSKEDDFQEEIQPKKRLIALKAAKNTLALAKSTRQKKRAKQNCKSDEANSRADKSINMSDPEEKNLDEISLNLSDAVSAFGF